MERLISSNTSAGTALFTRRMAKDSLLFSSWIARVFNVDVGEPQSIWPNTQDGRYT